MNQTGPYVSVQWKQLPTSNEGPPVRAYQSLTALGSRYLLFGGFDGKSTFGDFWWLVPEEDPISKRSAPSFSKHLPEEKKESDVTSQSVLKKSQHQESAISELQRRCKAFAMLSSSEHHILDVLEDKELQELASNCLTERVSRGPSGLESQDEILEMLRGYWRKVEPCSIKLKELGPLLRDYQRLIKQRHLDEVRVGFDTSSASIIFKNCAYQYYHVKDASQLRMNDIAKLLSEYREILNACF